MVDIYFSFSFSFQTALVSSPCWPPWLAPAEIRLPKGSRPVSSVTSCKSLKPVEARYGDRFCQQNLKTERLLWGDVSTNQFYQFGVWHLAFIWPINLPFANLVSDEMRGGGSRRAHSSAVAIMLLTQRPQVRITCRLEPI